MESKTKNLGLLALIGLLLIGVVALSGCIGCGDLNQNCCEDNKCNSNNLVCSESKCLNCGSVSELCCEGEVCDEGVCFDGKCGECGSIGDLCCVGNACDEGVCSNGKCEKCGEIGELCCGGDKCDEGVCSDGKCYECGNFSELCCAGNVCNEGICSNGKCKDYDELSTEEIKSNSQRIPYNELMRNSENYIGDIIYYRVELFEKISIDGEFSGLTVRTKDDGNLLRIYITTLKNREYATIDTIDKDKTIDTIDMWGEFKGIEDIVTIYGSRDGLVPDVREVSTPYFECLHIEVVT